MIFKKYHLMAVFACLFALSISIIFMSGMAVATAQDKAAPVSAENSIGSDDAPNTIDKPSSSGVSLQTGDIIATKNAKKIIIPGTYKHVIIYVGSGKFVEADPSNGVHYCGASGYVYRVSTSSTVKAKAVTFIKQQVGKAYDFNLLTKQVYGNRYYCSELAWAGYKVAGGPDIDKNPGYHWLYQNAVAPQEIADDGNTYYVGTY